jgi:hypothetical protein
MKISHLTETSTTSGAIAPAAVAAGPIQRRGKGSIFSGISTSEKFPNSKSVEEGLGGREPMVGETCFIRGYDGHVVLLALTSDKAQVKFNNGQKEVIDREDLLPSTGELKSLWEGSAEDKRLADLTRTTDAELAAVMQNAKDHYTTAENPELAFKKWVQRSLSHAKKDDEKQNRTLDKLTGDVASLKKVIDMKRKPGIIEGINLVNESADQVTKVFKKNGKPVGEVGIDPEASPGNGNWYMKCYANNIDNSGYDSYEEAVAELKHCLKQSVTEGALGDESVPFQLDPKKQGWHNGYNNFPWNAEYVRSHYSPEDQPIFKAEFSKGRAQRKIDGQWKPHDEVHSDPRNMGESTGGDDPKAKALGKFAYYAITAKQKEEPSNPYPTGTKSNADFEEGYDNAFTDQNRRYLAAPLKELVMTFGVEDRLPLLRKNVTEAEVTESDLIRAPGKGRQYHPGLLNKPEVSVNPTDTVKVDIPLLIRLLEFAREDANTDMDLHDLAEKLIAAGARGKTLTMRDYESVVPEVAPKQPEQEVDETRGDNNWVKTNVGDWMNLHTGRRYTEKYGGADNGGNSSYMTPDYMMAYYKKRLGEIETGRYKYPKEVARIHRAMAKLQGQQAHMAVRSIAPDANPEVDEGRMIAGPGGVPLDRQGNPIPPKAPAGPRVVRDKNGLTKEDYSKVWRKLEAVVGQIFPDGDPIDYMAPWLKKGGVQEFRIGDILDKACRLNGFNDMYAYYDHFKDGDYGYEEPLDEAEGQLVIRVTARSNPVDPSTPVGTFAVTGMEQTEDGCRVDVKDGQGGWNIDLKKQPSFLTFMGTESDKPISARAAFKQWQEAHGEADAEQPDEKLDELSIGKVRDYSEKVKAAPVKSIHQAIMHFRGQEKAQDRIHRDELKKIDVFRKV